MDCRSGAFRQWLVHNEICKIEFFLTDSGSWIATYFLLYWVSTRILRIKCLKVVVNINTDRLFKFGHVYKYGIHSLVILPPYEVWNLVVLTLYLIDKCCFWFCICNTFKKEIEHLQFCGRSFLSIIV